MNQRRQVDRVTLKGYGEALKSDKYALKGNKDILKGHNGKAFNCNKNTQGLHICIKRSH